MYGGEQSARVQDSIRRLGDAANRASVVIYSIDPRGLAYTGLGEPRRAIESQPFKTVLQFLWSLWIEQCGVFLRENAT